MPGAAHAGSGRQRGAAGWGLRRWRGRGQRGVRSPPAGHGPALTMRSRQVGEQSRPELLALPGAPEPPGAAYRASLEEDAGSLSGESLDGHLQGEWGPLPFLSRSRLPQH